MNLKCRRGGSGSRGGGSGTSRATGPARCVGPVAAVSRGGRVGTGDALQGLLSRAGAELCGQAAAVPPCGDSPSSQERGSVLCWYLVHQLCTGPVLQHNWLCVPAAPEIIPALASLLSCASAWLCPRVGSEPQELEAALQVAPVARGDAQGRARRGRGRRVPGAGQEPRRRSSCRRGAGCV